MNRTYRLDVGCILTAAAIGLSGALAADKTDPEQRKPLLGVRLMGWKQEALIRFGDYFHVLLSVGGFGC